MDEQAKLDRADQKNKRFIARNRRNLLAQGLHPCPEELLETGTPAERAAYVRLASRRIVKVIAGMVLIFAVIHALPESPVETPPPPTFSPAGTVSAIELHETAFSTSSTVVTTEGTFQVRGAVSGAVGDVAKVERSQKAGTGIDSLCIESKFKSGCYQLL